MKKYRETSSPHSVRPIDDADLERATGSAEDDWETPLTFTRPLTGIYEIVDGRLVRV